MKRISRLVPVLVMLAATAFIAAPAGAQGYVSITGCSVEPTEVFLAPGESATLTLSVEGDDDWAWTTIVSDGVVIVDEAQRASDIGFEYTHGMVAAQVTDSITQTWWAVDVAGEKVGLPLCTATISLASDEIPVVGSTMLPVVVVAVVLVLLGALPMVLRRRSAPRD